jgi:hypothetical protein
MKNKLEFLWWEPPSCGLLSLATAENPLMFSSIPSDLAPAEISQWWVWPIHLRKNTAPSGQPSLSLASIGDSDHLLRLVRITGPPVDWLPFTHSRHKHCPADP